MHKTAHAVIYRASDGSLRIEPPCTTRACAVEAISPFEGSAVFGIATIEVEQQAISGLAFRSRENAEAEHARMREALVRIAYAAKSIVDLPLSEYVNSNSLAAWCVETAQAALAGQQEGEK